MTDYTELKRLAETAPSGPWLAENDSLYFRDDGYTRHLLDADAGHDVEDEAYYAALNFIVAANPAAVLALIAENERLQESHEQICTNYNQVSYASEERGKQRDQLKAELEHTGYDHDLLRNERDQLKAENEALRESNEKLTRRNGMLEQNVEVMTETHILYTWLRKKCDQPSSDVVAVHMNIGHDWATVHDLDTDLRAMIEREEP